MMPRLWSLIRQKPVRASAGTSLRASTTIPIAGITSLDNAQGASRAITELLNSLDATLAQVSLEDDPKFQLTAQLAQLDWKASNYANSSLDFCSSKTRWDCTARTANLIHKAWVCAETVYTRNIAVPLEELKDSDLNIEWYLPSSGNGNIKATTVTTFVEPLSQDTSEKPSTYVIIAVRGSASTVDQVVNLNGESRDARILFKDTEQASSTNCEPKFQAHAGFLNSTQELLPHVSAQIEKQIKKGEKFSVLLTGHSAGGAVSVLLHLTLRSKYRNIPFSCITFGCPPVVKVLVEEDKDTLNRIIAEAPILNIVNEYDLVSRLDGSYVRSILQLYDSERPENPDTTEGVSEQRWPLPSPDLHHVGAIIILRTELTDMRLSSAPISPANLRVTGWSVTSQDLSNLVFCDLQVHKRAYYRAKIERLVRSICDIGVPLHKP